MGGHIRSDVTIKKITIFQKIGRAGIEPKDADVVLIAVFLLKVIEAVVTTFLFYQEQHG